MKKSLDNLFPLDVDCWKENLARKVSKFLAEFAAGHPNSWDIAAGSAAITLLEIIKEELDADMETIERAAVRYNGTVYSVPAPGRHHNVVRMMHDDYGLGPETMQDQGFVTSTGRYVSREEACHIAKAAGQIKIKTHPAHVLFSEDVW